MRRRAEREWFVCSQAFAVGLRGEVTEDSGLKLPPLSPEARDLHKTDEEVRNISVERYYSRRSYVLFEIVGVIWC